MQKNWITLITAAGIAAFALVGCGKTYEEEAAVPRVFTLERGTQLTVTPAEGVVPQKMNEGELFAGVLARPLEHDGFLIAPSGAPVAGTIVSQEIEHEGETRTVRGVSLESVTLHGGEDFAISTAPLFQEIVVLDDPDAQPEISSDRDLIFVLDEPAEVSLVIDREEATT